MCKAEEVVCLCSYKLQVNMGCPEVSQGTTSTHSEVQPLMGSGLSDIPHIETVHTHTHTHTHTYGHAFIDFWGG